MESIDTGMQQPLKKMTADENLTLFNIRFDTVSKLLVISGRSDKRYLCVIYKFDRGEETDVRCSSRVRNSKY